MKGYTKFLLLAGFSTVIALIVITFAPGSAARSGSQKASGKSAAQRQTERSKVKLPAAKKKPTPDMTENPDEAEENDPDRPARVQGKVNQAEYLRQRQEWVNSKLGMEPGMPYDPMIRQEGIKQMRAQEKKIQEDVVAGRISPRVLSTGWTNIGPFPIPDGQTSGVVNPVSGRTVAIAVHPTNPDLVYVGAAQGGVYRSTNGGLTWTQLFDSADSQVIGALTLAPSNPDILYVGTGEAGQCGSGCYAGIGLYRVDNASTTATLTGPINPVRNYNDAGGNPVSTGIFTGRTISKILVNPSDPSIVFVATASGIVGNPQQAPGGNTIPPLAIRGLYRLANATGPAAGVTATKLTVSATNCFDLPCTGNLSILDMVYDGLDATGNTIALWLRPTTGAEGGVYRTTTALSTATFTNTFSQVSTANSRGELASVTIGGVTTMYLASGESSTGRIRKSVDGGQTFGAILPGASGFCGGQCFYDIAIAIDPTNADIAYVGGAAGTSILRKTTDGFGSAANTPSRQDGLHADNHVLVVASAPNNNIVYDGNDGGIFKTTNAAASWQSLNTRTYSATQFQSVANHSTERFFVIGGTQDNGTEWLQPNAFSQLPFDGWTHADFGDGGYARIDQTQSSTTTVTMYHTYFNQTNNLLGFARVSSTLCARDGQWAFKGVGAGAFVNACGDVEGGNGIGATDAVLFYAPLELGPAVIAGGPNTVYYGSDRLYRSTDRGDTMVNVSSAAAIVATVPITTIAIAPSDDNYRFVGLNNGGVWGSTTGVPASFVNVTPPVTSARAVGKIIIDPNDKNTAYVGYGGQFGTAAPAIQHIWKTTNLNAPAPTWTAVGNGIPDVPVNALAVDPNNSLVVLAGTDVGVYRSVDGGINWLPYNTGMPKIAIFDLQIQNANRLVRAATHGRGIWEIALDSSVTISGQITGANSSGVTMQLTGSAPAPLTTVTDGGGNYSFTGLTVGGNYTVRPVATATVAFTPTNRTYPDIPSSRTNQNYVTGAPPPPVPLPLVATPGQVIITEFRLRGVQVATTSTWSSTTTPTRR